ncbi:hypothetical protein EMGBS7_04800 [Candidatus Planktophila sp.]|nr:hypothetical protein EMGBS7_04800 [Candidatus Planktophila sp.]
MAKLNMQSATARRSLVIKLVDDALIHSQNDLVRELGKLGYVVTQATASRDLEELGAVRGKTTLGSFVINLFLHHKVQKAEVFRN